MASYAPAAKANSSIAHQARAVQATASRSSNLLAGTQSIRRAVAILKEISAYGQGGIRLVDIANAMQLERPTVHRIIRGLMSQGMVAQNPRSKLYTLGPVVYELGLAAAPLHNLRELCQPSLHRLAQRSGDSVYLVMRSGMDSVCLDRLEGNFPIKTQTLDIGRRRPLGSGASGMAILLVEHDMELVMRCVDHIFVLNHGELLAQGDRQHIQNHPAVIAAYLGTDAELDAGAAV